MNISKLAKVNIRQIEEQIRHLPKEKLVITDRNGKKVLEQMGKEHSVGPNKLKRKILIARVLEQNKRDIFTHNHPTGYPQIAPDDAKIAFTFNTLETRSVSPSDKIYLIEIPKNLSLESRIIATKLCTKLDKTLKLQKSSSMSEFHKKYRIFRNVIEREIPGVKFRTLV